MANNFDRVNRMKTGSDVTTQQTSTSVKNEEPSTTESSTSTTEPSQRAASNDASGYDAGEDDEEDEDNELDTEPLCKVMVGETSSERTSGGKALDRLGRPVYLSSSRTIVGELSWWSQDSKLLPSDQTYQQMQTGAHYVTLSGGRNELFEYENLSELLHDLRDQTSNNTDPMKPKLHSKASYRLKYPMASNRSLLVYDNYVYYIGRLNSSNSNKQLTLADLVLVAEQLETSSRKRHRFEMRLVEEMNSINVSSSNGSRQVRLLSQLTNLVLSDNHAINQIELASDESGVWLIVPTVEFAYNRLEDGMSTTSNNNVTLVMQQQQQQQMISNRRRRVIRRRRLHVARVRLSQLSLQIDAYQAAAVYSSVAQETGDKQRAATSGQRHEHRTDPTTIGRDRYYDNDNATTMTNRPTSKMTSNILSSLVDTTRDDQAEPGRIGIDYHVSMKLNWHMIGQLFIIDGILYCVKDRHSYSSKLQFAYDLNRCKLLPSDYLNEPQRTFTSHFGGTQMIKYNPNEPKRLYTIDNGNLLWCPVKLLD